MFVMCTSAPPPISERLDGVVYGVKLRLATLGNGTSRRKLRGPLGPSTPCARPA